MADTCETVRVVAHDPEQGDFVVINKDDFDSEVHTLYADPGVDEPNDDDAVKAEKAELVALIVARGGDKPHHATGVAKLQEILASLPSA